MKKICFITTIPLTLNAFVLNTAKYIHENTDWDVSFICSDENDFGSSLPKYIHYFPIKMERGISIAGVKAMLEMKKVFKREKFDLIQYSTPNASLYASMAGRLAHVPVRLYCQWGMAFVGFQGLKRKIFQMEEKYVCHLSTHIEPDSNSNLRFAHEIGLYPKSKGSVIWNGSACGVNLTKFDISNKEEYRKDIRKQLDIPEDAFVYGFVGRITRDKGVNELLEAYKKLNDDSYLIMVGPSEVDETINQELYTWASKNEKIKFTGYTIVVEQYLSAMDCYILPSYREGFGMGVVEAEAMGVPVIVTDIPGPTDAMIDNETGIVVQKADVESLYNAMISIREDKVRYFAMAEKAHDFAVYNFEQKQLFNYILEDRKKLLGE
ncbi:glycosyltransferase [uncultured Eubacterium sp.]|uniref:glycosyltransferase n=1 Tax=uncultured Eubacterium sp. TaxID=165185 RepID=UPI00258EF38B|nr:glycosyltransferase [uncultured Eubacterium sp.]